MPAQLQKQRLVGKAAGRPRQVGSTLPRSLRSSLSTPTSSSSRTYTTAGTVYNPDAAAPMQPPARKGRIDRWDWNQPRPTPSLRSTPDGQLPNLAVSRPPRTGSRLESYAPLQQNYDRAATPPPRDKPFRRVKKAAAAPLEGMTPPGPDAAGKSLDELLPDNVLQPSVEGGDEEHEDPEFAAAVDALASQFNAQGLTNLASYKNPSQKAARRALARAHPSSSSSAPTSSRSEPLARSKSQKSGAMAYRGARQTQTPFPGAHQTCPPGCNVCARNGCFTCSSGDRMPFRGPSFVPAGMMPVNMVPVNMVPTNMVPTNMVPANNVFPNNNIPNNNMNQYPATNMFPNSNMSPYPATNMFPNNNMNHMPANNMNNMFPANNIPAKHMNNMFPANNMNHMPANNTNNMFPTNMLPANNFPANNMPINMLPANNMNNTFPANNIPANSIPANIPGNSIPANNMPVNMFPANSMPTNMFPANNMPTNMPINMFPANNMPTNMPINTYPNASLTGPPPPLPAGPPGLRRPQPSLRHSSPLGHLPTGHSAPGYPWSDHSPPPGHPRRLSDASTPDWSTEDGDSACENGKAEEDDDDDDDDDDGDEYPKRLRRLINNVLNSGPPPKPAPIGPPSKEPKRPQLKMVGGSPEKVAESMARARAAFMALPGPLPRRQPPPPASPPEPLEPPPVRINDQRTPEELERHRRKVDRDWYSGIKNIHKSVDDIVRENSKRRMFRAVGRFEQADAMHMRNSRLEKTENRPMTIEEANAMSTAEHAAPLLKMALATLLSHAEEGGFCRRRTGWVTPDPRLIDDSEAGLRSFFAS